MSVEDVERIMEETQDSIEYQRVSFEALLSLSTFFVWLYFAYASFATCIFIIHSYLLS